MSALGLAVQFLAGPGRRKLGPDDHPQTETGQGASWPLPPTVHMHSHHRSPPPGDCGQWAAAREQEGEETASGVMGPAVTGPCVSSERMSCEWNS